MAPAHPSDAYLTSANWHESSTRGRSGQQRVGRKALLAGDDELSGTVHHMPVHSQGAVARLVEMATSISDEREHGRHRKAYQAHVMGTIPLGENRPVAGDKRSLSCRSDQVP